MHAGETTTNARTDEVAVLNALAGELAGQFALGPLLERILTGAVQLLGCESGSLCTIDQATATYRKEVDLGVGCAAGSVFPLDEGVTGAVVRAGRTVVFDDYSHVPDGHVDRNDPRHHRAVIGVPIRLDATMIGTCIVFGAADGQTFASRDAELLELFATHASVAIANSRLHTLLGERRQAAVVAAERERAVRDVHDSVARAMTAVSLHLGTATAAAESGTSPIAELARIRLAVSEALAETTRSAHALSPEPPDLLPLDEAIAHELEWVATTAAVRTQLVVVGEPRPVPAGTSRELLRIVQEALTNVAAHAHATSVRLGLVHSPDSIGVIVEDDGVGFDPTRLDARGVAGAPDPGQRPTGWGLSGLSARARQVGGSVQIDSTPAWGTRVRVDLPTGSARPSGPDVPRWRVVVVHDEPLVRAGLVRLLARAEPGLQVVAEFDDASLAVEGIALLAPDVVIADIDLDQADGPRFTARVAGVAPTAAVVLLLNGRRPVAVRSDDGRSDVVARSLAAGARGFVDRTTDAVSLGRAVVAAANGDWVLSGDLVSRLGGSHEGAVDGLTARERQVRDLVEQGLADKQIAARLGISPKTVEKHVGTILRKTGARNRTQLASLPR